MNLMAVEIEINSECNLQCNYCPNSTNTRLERGEMELSLFKKIMLDLHSINFSKRLSYHFYGEPLINSRLTTYITVANDMLSSKVSHMIFTNGVLLTEHRLYELIDAGVNYFYITHHTGVQDLPIYSFYEQLPQKIKNRIKIKRGEQLDLTTRSGLVQVNTKNAQVLTSPCLIPEQSMYITKEGNVLPCFEDYQQKEAMGNIKNMSLMKIWSSNKYQQFIKNAKKGHRDLNTICNGCISTQQFVI